MKSCTSSFERGSRPLPRGHSVEAGRVAQVLEGRHLLEEGGLDGHPVDEPPHRPCVGEDIVAEDVRGAAVVQEQRREQTDQGRLARAVLPEDRDGLPALHRERDALEGRNPFLVAEAPTLAIAPEEVFPQADDLDGGSTFDDGLQGDLGLELDCLGHVPTPCFGENTACRATPAEGRGTRM
jgi:hypothetical protein